MGARGGCCLLGASVHPPPRASRPAVTAAPRSEVRHLATKSSVCRSQKRRRFHIKDSQKGPIVWEVKHADFHRKHADGVPDPTHTLIIARNALDHDEVKCFVANAAAGMDIEKPSKLLHLAFSRFPIDHCFRQAKDERNSSATCNGSTGQMVR